MPVIYIDILFLTNLAVNYMLLFAVGRATHASIRQLRLIGAAAMGACYSVVMFFPTMMFLYHGMFKLLFSALMLLAAFPRESWKAFAKQTVYFYLISFAFAGGAEFANHYFRVLRVQNGIVYFESSIWVLLFSCLAAYWILPFFMRLLTTRYQKQPYIRDLLIGRNGKEVVLRGLVDTGNSLHDPLTGKPVVVAELSSVLPLLAEQEIICFRREELNPELPFRLIPYQGIHGRAMLKGFEPDYAELAGKRIKIVVAVKNDVFSQDGSFCAILHSELL